MNTHIDLFSETGKESSAGEESLMCSSHEMTDSKMIKNENHTKPLNSSSC